LKKYYPITATQTSVAFNVHECDEKEAEKYFLSTERSKKCKKIGCIILQSPDITNGINRVFMIKIRFGKTQFEIEATDMATQNKIESKFDFMSSQ